MAAAAGIVGALTMLAGEILFCSQDFDRSAPFENDACSNDDWHQEDDLLLDIAVLREETKVTEQNSRRNRNKIQNFVSEVVPKYLDDDFSKHFRLQRSSVQFIIQEIGSEFEKLNSLGRPKTDVLKCVLLSIWTISNQECFRTVCDRFGVAPSNGYQIFCEFTAVMSKRVNRFVKWPTGNEVSLVRKGFDCFRAEPFPNVIGCIDGSYIPIKGLKIENESYCTRKKFRAVILQAVCDSNKKFIDIFSGWPGSSHDSRVWRNSPLYQKLSAPDNVSVLPQNCHLLGDSAYPLDTFLMTPYKDNGHLTSKQKHFNKKLSSVRVVIENAFGLLKTRFRRLKFLDMIRMDRVPKVITTACILHNICIDQGDYLDEICADEDLIDANGLNNETTRVGSLKRDNIADILYNF